MKKWLLVSFLLSTLAFGSQIHLKDKLSEAEPGSYIVTEQNKNFTLIYIHERTAESVVIEEVTIPTARFCRNPMPWQQWFESGSPGHTSWTMSQIHLQSGRFLATFSFPRQEWVALSDSGSFLTTLLNLTFYSVPDEKRRRVGTAPGYNKPDRRPIWNPLLTVNGQRIAQIPFALWQARWPADGSELSRKYIEIYLPYECNDPSIPDYPTYFPYWIEVDGKIGSAKLRIIDSGTGARSPKSAFSTHPSTLIGNEKGTEEALALYLSVPQNSDLCFYENVGAL